MLELSTKTGKNEPYRLQIDGKTYSIPAPADLPKKEHRKFISALSAVIELAGTDNPGDQEIAEASENPQLMRAILNLNDVRDEILARYLGKVFDDLSERAVQSIYEEWAKSGVPTVGE